MELDFLAWLSERLPDHRGVAIGVGDDAALLADPRVVATADALVDGVHFRVGEHTPERVGRKALAVNLSDLAAMAARPVGALVSLVLPRQGAGGLACDELARRTIEGMLPLCEEFGCPLVGGDTNIGPGPLVIAVTALGAPPTAGVVRRNGARPGDALLVTGDLGGSLAGKHLDFTPRVREAIKIHEALPITAMMDLSDGLSLDLRRLCEASGVGAVVNAAALPASRAAHEAARRSGKPVLDHVVGDGEDFELLVAASMDPADEVGTVRLNEFGLTLIGNTVAEPGLFLAFGDGTTRPLEPNGYEHR